MDFDEWLKFGFDQGWIGPPVCSTHDGIPMTLLEERDFEDGDDPCIHILRLYQDNVAKDEIEANHSPSQWRATRFDNTHPRLFDPDLYAD